MSDEIKVNRVATQSPSPAAAPVMSAPAKTSKMPWVILAVIVVVLVVVGVLFRDKLMPKSKTDAATMKASDYDAVFLTNGQVYFGKMTDAEGEYATLKDIYYLQVVQQPGLQGSGQTPEQQQQQTQPQISLVKLGNELHGPVDEMKISRNQILFFESMKEDSQVVQAIKNYKANPQGSAAPAGQQQQQQVQQQPVAPTK
ncbi:MAG: hypothetical protein HY918_01770 [Candidatus Doudnabacteria bacterium]|nr:hypothetical protein [Candidatus Doudnabacteria bacterium]